MRFQVGGYELGTNFVVVYEAMGIKDLLLGRNFSRTYQVLVDLTARTIVVQAAVKSVCHQSHTQVVNPDSAVPVVLDQNVVTQPFGRTVVRTTVVTDNLEPLIFQNVMFNASKAD